jgi:hypothetical protein
MDPRLAVGRAGLSPVNYAHDLFLRANPNARDVRFESNDAGQFRITGGEQYRQGILDALSQTLHDPVVAGGYVPGLGDFDRAYGGPLYRHYGYRTPDTGAFQFAPLEGGVLRTPTRPPATASNLRTLFNPYTGQWVYETDLQPVAPADVMPPDPNAPAFTPEYQGATAATPLPSGAPAVDYPSLLLGVPQTPERFALQSRYYYGSPFAPVLAEWRTPAPPPPSASASRESRSTRPASPPPPGGAAPPAPGGPGGEPSGTPDTFGVSSGSLFGGAPPGPYAGGNAPYGPAAPGSEGASGVGGGGDVGFGGGADAMDAGGWVMPAQRAMRPLRSARDTVPARLTPGEFVVNADTAQQPGVGRYLETLNARRPMSGAAARPMPGRPPVDPEAW